MVYFFYTSQNLLFWTFYIYCSVLCIQIKSKLSVFLNLSESLNASVLFFFFLFKQVCGKSFNRMYNLLGHMHLHAGSKPFKCAYCSSRFNLKGNLSRHMKVKHGMDVSPEGQGKEVLAKPT